MGSFLGVGRYLWLVVAVGGVAPVRRSPVVAPLLYPLPPVLSFPTVAALAAVAAVATVLSWPLSVLTGSVLIPVSVVSLPSSSAYLFLVRSATALALVAVVVRLQPVPAALVRWYSHLPAS